MSALNALKTWLVSPGTESVCKATHWGSHVKRVVTRNGFCFAFYGISHDFLLPAKESDCTVCPLRAAAIHDVSDDDPHTASELSALKTWVVKYTIESVCKVIDCGSQVKRVRLVIESGCKVTDCGSQVTRAQYTLGWSGRLLLFCSLGLLRLPLL